MRSFFIAFGIFVGLACAPAFANGPDTARTVPMTLSSSGEVAATPEMWFYEQSMQQYLDPQMAVRKRAEMRAAERDRRLAAMRWFGFSNSRPQVSGDPVYTDYSPRWISNNYWYPSRWSGAGYSTTVVNGR